MPFACSRRRWLALLTGTLAGLISSRADELEPDEAVLLFPALAFPAADGTHWELELQAVVFEHEVRLWTEGALRQLLEREVGQLTAAEQALLTQRLRRFLRDHERGKSVRLQVAGTELNLGKSGADGRLNRTITVPAAILGNPSLTQDSSRKLPARLLVEGGSRGVVLEVICLGRDGVSVVSDLDDTIKVTGVGDRATVLRRTFCEPFVAVEGMAARYAVWSARGASFHYVSGSPWQLYEPLRAFTDTGGFTGGTWHLREFRPRSRQVLRLEQPPATHKLKAITPLIERLPHRGFVLVGDSGEKDPEIYGTLARRHPEQVRAIFIREVTAEAPDSPRYRKAFAGIPPERWRIFRTPDELPQGW